MTVRELMLKLLEIGSLDAEVIVEYHTSHESGILTSIKSELIENQVILKHDC